MGDCAMAVPVINGLMKKYPQVEITVVTKAFFVPVFESIPGVIVVAADTKGEHKGLKGVVKLGRQLRKMEFDKLADFHNVLRSKIIDSIFSAKGIKTANIDKGRREKKALVRTKSKIFKPLKTTPERYADVLRKLGFELELSADMTLPKPQLPSKAADLLGEKQQKWIGIAQFAAHASKTYPLDLTEEVLAGLNLNSNYKILLFGGGKKEKEQLKTLETKFKNSVCIAGELSFKEEIQLIGNLDLMLSMDSGNGHLAAMYGVPVLTLWGETHPYAGFAPFGQPDENQLIPDLEKYPLLPTSVFGKKQYPGYEDVMRTISPEQVLERIHQILGD